MRIALAGLLGAGLVTGLAVPAAANGRDPYTSTINFQRGNDQHIVAGMTFGAVISEDGGGTWHWMCERTIGYGGMYDPDYVYSDSGAIFATTFDGLKVMRDGCSFVSTPPGMTFVSKVEQSAKDGSIYYAAADQADGKIYKSTDDGMTFPTSANPGQPGDWWSSLAVAPSSAAATPPRIYLTGYRLDGAKVFLLYTSTDGGTSYTPMNVSDFMPLSANSTIEIVGIDSTDDKTVYAKVTFENGSVGDSVYKSTDAGQSWTKILSKSSNFGLAFLARKGGGCVAGTRELGAWQSPNCDTNWTELTNAPHIGCLYQNSTGEVWACTQNYASPQLDIPSDDYGIMKTTDLVTWTGVLKYQDIAGPIPCDAGTVQEDECVQRFMDQPSQWCCLVSQLGITSTAVDCTGELACTALPAGDAPSDAGTTMKPGEDPGCCGTGSGKSSVMLSLLVAGALLLRRRRPKEP
jgi:MYXO-CTERM domain-containing protein